MDSPNWKLVLFLAICLLSIKSATFREERKYSDQYILETNGSPEDAKQLAVKYGFIYVAKIFDNIYSIKDALSLPDRCSINSNLTDISTDPNVAAITHSRLLIRVKRHPQT